MNPLGGLRETGGLPFFLPKGALTHHRVGTNSISFAPPQAAGLIHSVVPPFPTKSMTLWEPFCGGGMPCGIVRSPRGTATAAAASRQCHSTCECCCHHLRRRQISCVERSKSWGRNSLPPLPPACANLPPAALPQRWTVRLHRPFSLLRKRNRKKETR